MKYFYAPICNDPDGRIDPGMDDGVGVIVSAVSELPAGVTSPMCDRGPEQRFVLVTPDSFDILLGWMERTKEEINLDYPGLIP
jgi:hypothetical protein